MSMRVVSFDVFDTLLVRSVGEPQDVFLALGEAAVHQKLLSVEAPAFCNARIASELNARRRVPHNEVSLDNIYTELAKALNLDTATLAQLKAMEIDFEKQFTRAVPEMLGQVKQRRSEGNQILFVSDMYLPRLFFVETLERYGFLQKDDRLYLSHELKASKASGRIFELIRHELPEISAWTHVGDNLHADVLSPQQHGIQTTHFQAVHLSRYEQLALGQRKTRQLWRSKLAGAMRLARLSGHYHDQHLATIWNTGTNVVGPMLFGFVHWCLQQAAERNIKRLYFVSRDGQILHRIAHKIVHAGGPQVECRYLYGSRQAWHPAGIGKLGESDLEWILLPTRRLSLEQALHRVNLEPEPYEQHFRAAGFPKDSWDRELTGKKRQQLHDLLLTPPLSSAVEHEAACSRSLLMKYLVQEGFFDGTLSALVDIGWHGNMQYSLSKALSLAGCSLSGGLTGLYFGLVRCNRFDPNDVLLAYWNRVRRHLMQSDSKAIYEMFTAADHGSVHGYFSSADRTKPRIPQPINQRALDWGLAVHQQSVLAFAECWTAEVRPCEFPATQFPDVIAEIFDAFYSRPTREEALAWGSFPFSEEQVEQAFHYMIPIWTRFESLVAIFNRSRRPPEWWLEGIAEANGHLVLRFYLLLKRLKQWYRARSFQRCPI